MTNNQIQYWRNIETNRANVANETETNRSNLARERETNRSNLANEAETRRSNYARENETRRHNLATERLGLSTLAETKRSNKVVEAETRRSNQARERETTRSNVARETENTKAREEDVKVRNRQASTAHFSANTNRLATQSQIEKNVVSNLTSLAALAETSRANIARESETTRSNRAKETISYNTYGLQRQQLTEQRRHNVATERLESTRTTLNFISNLANAIGRVAGTVIRKGV